MNTSDNYSNNGKAKSKYSRPYRNRPSKRQAILEFLSFLIFLVAAPAFLGGVFSIFICIAAIALAIIGLFAWTRRHLALFSILALLIIIACIANIILRSLFLAQCLPYFYYSGANRFGAVAAPIVIVNNNGTTNNNGTVVPPIPPPNNSTATNTTGLLRQMDDDNNNNNNNNNNGDNNNDDDYNGKHYNNSIWCGHRDVVYITNAILILLTALALLVALSLLKKRKTPALPVSKTTTTQTVSRTFVEQ